ncbi:hypothetical protein T05_11287 [Trichinella murrelli]|uniref:Uncharacterized protein n=1 Tax=Trichinella murrelli TaxID=144512 RepID=A0A0V0TGI2_9BILA|nr:hypothetical protein T05_11287 [Trichinella murrelli]
MPSAFLPFFLPPDYSYNQFLCQAGRPAKAQLCKSGRNNPAPGCWESCLELPGSRLFRNRTQILPVQVERQNGVLKYSAIRGQIFPNSQTIYDGQQFTPQEHMKGKQLLVPGGDNLKGPIPAPAVTLSQQPHTSLVGKN